jgi:hypothetical protein
MDNIGLYYLVFLVVVGIGGIVLLTWLRKMQQRRRFYQEASARGWCYDDTGWLGSSYRFSGTTGGDIAWTAECVASSGGDEVSSTIYQTRWWNQAISLPDRLVLIGPRMPVAGVLPVTLQGGGLGSTLVRTFLRQLFGDEADRLDGMGETLIGSEAFGQRYMVYAHDTHDASRLLGMGVEPALLDWPKQHPLAVKLGGNELTIWRPSLEITQITQVEQILSLGTRIVNAWRSM